MHATRPAVFRMRGLAAGAGRAPPRAARAAREEVRMRARWWTGAFLLLTACAAATHGQNNTAWQTLPSPVGREAWVLAQTSNVFASVAPAVELQRDACGSLIVRRAGDTSPVRLLIAVGVDEPGYVVSQIRDDGLLRLRTV